MNWRQEKQALEDAYARRLLVEYNIREVTTQRQAKNGTREFEFPVKTKWKKEPLRLACFKSGYVRKQNDTSSPYQLNKTYKQNVRWTLLTENGLETKEYISIARAKIWSGLARMNYMLEYYKRNWLNK
tara:strand:+ start:191 stop:574 length:384 start_codon:yes stop_codon:yes gene_type:complete